MKFLTKSLVLSYRIIISYDLLSIKKEILVSLSLTSQTVIVAKHFENIKEKGEAAFGTFVGCKKNDFLKGAHQLCSQSHDFSDLI